MILVGSGSSHFLFGSGSREIIRIPQIRNRGFSWIRIQPFFIRIWIQGNDTDSTDPDPPLCEYLNLKRLWSLSKYKVGFGFQFSLNSYSGTPFSFYCSWLVGCSLNFFLLNLIAYPGSGPGSGSKLGQNSRSGFKFHVFGSTTLVSIMVKIILNPLHCWKSWYFYLHAAFLGHCSSRTVSDWVFLARESIQGTNIPTW